MINKRGPIVIVEDDMDDQFILSGLFAVLGYVNDVLFFDNGLDLIDYLIKPNPIPFIILSDINMPKMNGFELRSRIFSDSSLNCRCIPFIFFTESASPSLVEKAFSLSIQGFFRKPKTIIEMDLTLRRIVEYWMVSMTP